VKDKLSEIALIESNDKPDSGDIRKDTSVLDSLVGGGEMGRILRSMDWIKTPLGPIESWPQSLLTTVSLCLASNFPISLAWGPKHVQIYNDGYWPICGGKHPQAMGQDFSECWASAWPVIGEAFERALAGETSYLENQRMFLDRNGYLEETFFTFSFSPIRDESGGVGGLFHPVTETTAEMVGERRMRALRDLVAQAGKAKTSEEAFTLSVQTLSEFELDVPFAMFYVLDMEGEEARLVAKTDALPDTLAIPTVDLKVPRSSVLPLAEVASANRTLRVDDLGTRFGSCGPYPEGTKTALALPITPPGCERPTAILVAGVSSRLALNDDYRAFYDLVVAAVGSAVANARAFEEERKRADALAEIDHAKTAFFSNISHEFRTPLTLMLGPLEDELSELATLTPARRERLNMAHRNALRLLKLVNTLLDFSSIEAGRLQANYEATDLAAFTAELASVFRSAVEKGGLTLTVDCPPLPEPVYIDQEMWEKVVLNLLANALKHTFVGGIHVNLRWRGDYAELAVVDSGVGIPEAELPHLFDRFHRVKRAISRTHEGTGIGLALVQELIRMHGGTVRVESQEGKGSTFTVTVKAGHAHLPVDQLGVQRSQALTTPRAAAYVEEALTWTSEMAAGPTPLSSAFEVAEGPNAVRPRILWADDNTDMREYVRRLLCERYEVTAVSDGTTALTSALATRPDLVLTDVMMPGLDGFALLRELRGDERTRTIPVILLSARAGEESAVEGLEVGADDYLVKPFSARELLARVATHLKMAKLRREWAFELEQSEERFRLLVSGVQDYAIFMLSPQGHVISWNKGAENIKGYRADEIIGEHFSRFYPSEAIAEGKPEWELQTAIEQGRMEDEGWRIRKDGQQFWANVVITALFDKNGYLKGFAKITRDMTERQRTGRALNAKNIELQAAAAAKDQFLANMSHELRTPLNGIIGFAEFLVDGKPGLVNPKQKECLEDVLNSGKHLLQLINDILDLAKVGAGKMELNPERFSLLKAIDEVCAVAKPIAQKKNIHIDVNVAPEIDEITLDQQKFKQVLYNLISNAIKFSHDSGKVEIRSELHDTDRVKLVVIDNGVGIKAEDVGRLFKEFEQLESGASRHYQGTGLGLALTRKIVEAQGGEVSVESEFGKGSRFTVVMPLIFTEQPRMLGTA
jgi:PAS domain S-box-containing protein